MSSPNERNNNLPKFIPASLPTANDIKGCSTNFIEDTHQKKKAQKKMAKESQKQQLDTIS